MTFKMLLMTREWQEKLRKYGKMEFAKKVLKGELMDVDIEGGQTTSTGLENTSKYGEGQRSNFSKIEPG